MIRLYSLCEGARLHILRQTRREGRPRSSWSSAELETRQQVGSEETGFWFSEASIRSERQVIRSSRIGVSYAGPIWAHKPYRFSLDNIK
jgi:hypothetical protein